MNKLARLKLRLQTSFWLVPTLLTLSMVIIAIILIDLDTKYDTTRLLDFMHIYTGGPDGSREMLSVIASSMITVTGVIFSIMILALAQASAQYSPYVLWHFLGNRSTQVVLGIIMGIFTYCIIVLRVIHSGSDTPLIPQFIPSLAILFGITLAFVGVGCLIFFIHYIAYLLQASAIINNISKETLKEIDRLYPEEEEKTIEKNFSDAAIQEIIDSHVWQPIPSLKSGYIQHIIPKALLHLACKNNTIFLKEHLNGGFVVEGMPLVFVAMVDKPSKKMIRDINTIFAIASLRSIKQDISFGLQLLVDITIKVMTVGIKDITTAIGCIDYLSAILTRLAQRNLDRSIHVDRQGQVRVIGKRPTYERLLNIAFDQIRHNSPGNITIILRLLHSLESIASQTKNPNRLRDLAPQLQLISAMLSRVNEEYDRQPAEIKIENIKKLL